MATGTYDIVANQGDTFQFVVTWKDGNKDPVDLTDRTARMQLRVTPDAEEVIAELTTENGGVTLGGTDGTIELFISAEDTAAIEPSSYKYDLEIITGDFVSKLLKGKFKLLAEVTK